jgi:hypothetical protein
MIFSFLTHDVRQSDVGVSSVRPHQASLSLHDNSLRRICSRFVSPRCHSRGLFPLVFVGGQSHPRAHTVFSWFLSSPQPPPSPMSMWNQHEGSCAHVPLRKAWHRPALPPPRPRQLHLRGCRSRRQSWDGCGWRRRRSHHRPYPPSPDATCVCHPSDFSCARSGVEGLACRGPTLGEAHRGNSLKKRILKSKEVGRGVEARARFETMMYGKFCGNSET